MSSVIDATAHVDPSCQIGFQTIIGRHVRIGKNCVIGHSVIIHDYTVIEDHVRIDDQAVIGKLPMASSQSLATQTGISLDPCRIHSHCMIGTAAILYRGSHIAAHTLVADLATVREMVEIGEHTIIGRNVAIENNCRIGSYCKIQTNAYITAFSTIEDYCFIAPGVCTSNDPYIGRSNTKIKFKGVTVNRGARIGVQATILPGVTIATESIVAAGAVMTKDTKAQTIYTGVPAREFRAVEPTQFVENIDRWKSK